MILDMCGGRDGFIRFSREAPYPALAFEGGRLTGHMVDDEALRIARHLPGIEPGHIVTKDRAEKVKAVDVLKHAGFTGKQIIRVTGLGKSFVYSHLRTKR